MRPPTRLRSPFVVTLAASATAVLHAGCGAAVVNPAGPDGSSTGDVPQDVPHDVQADVSRVCPVTPPTQGTGCSPATTPDHCDYGTVPGCPGLPATTAFCDNDTLTWRLAPSSCNPPPVPRCPESVPTSGTYCAGTIRCPYNDCAGVPTTLATCTNQRWELEFTSCNPPPPTCPASPPEDTSDCTFPTALQCTWGDCNGRPTVRAVCDSGHWRVDRGECELDAGAPADSG